MKRFLVIAALVSVLFLPSQNEEIDRLTVELTYDQGDSSKVDKSLLLISKLLEAQNYSKAFLYTNQTIDLAKSLNYTEGLARANFFKARIYNARDDYFNAIDNYQKSLSYYFQINDSLGLAKVSSKIGLLEIERGNYQKGLGYSLAAISTFEKFNLQEELSSAYNCLAKAYLNTNNIEKALEYNQKALVVRKSLGDNVGIKSTTVAIAYLYSERKEHRKAIDHYQEALRLLDPDEDIELRGKVLPKLGSEYLIFKEFEQARDYLLEGLRYNRENSNEEGLVITLNGLGNLNYQRRNLKTAEQQLLEAYSLAEKNNLKDELMENFRLRIELDSSRGYFQNAFKWQSEYYRLKESAVKEQNTKLGDPSPMLPNFSLAGNSSLKSSNAAASEGKQINEWLLYSLIGLCLVLLILSIILLSNNQKLKQKSVAHFDEVQKLSSHLDEHKEANQKLQDENQVKDKLFSIVSHDLKDSISSIKAFLDLLKEDSISREEFNELIPELSENANNASSLLYNLLNWSKSQLQSLEPKPEVFNIQDVFKDKMDLVEQKVEEKSIIVIDESIKDYVFADRSMIEIVIQNLISNAIKFSRNGDMITVSNSDKNGKSVICIEDTGVGISEENIGKLFNAANNFTTRGTKNEKGTGLGLSIAKDLVELNNGRIWVESTLNVGSKFFIELPKKGA